MRESFEKRVSPASEGDPEWSESEACDDERPPPRPQMRKRVSGYASSLSTSSSSPSSSAATRRASDGGEASEPERRLSLREPFDPAEARTGPEAETPLSPARASPLRCGALALQPNHRQKRGTRVASRQASPGHQQRLGPPIHEWAAKPHAGSWEPPAEETPTTGVTTQVSPKNLSGGSQKCRKTGNARTSASQRVE